MFLRAFDLIALIVFCFAVFAYANRFRQKRYDVPLTAWLIVSLVAILFGAFRWVFSRDSYGFYPWLLLAFMLLVFVAALVVAALSMFTRLKLLLVVKVLGICLLVIAALFYGFAILGKLLVSAPDTADKPAHVQTRDEFCTNANDTLDRLEKEAKKTATERRKAARIHSPKLGMLIENNNAANTNLAQYREKLGQPDPGTTQAESDSVRLRCFEEAAALPQVTNADTPCVELDATNSGGDNPSFTWQVHDQPAFAGFNSFPDNGTHKGVIWYRFGGPVSEPVKLIETTRDGVQSEKLAGPLNISQEDINEASADCRSIKPGTFSYTEPKAPESSTGTAVPSSCRSSWQMRTDGSHNFGHQYNRFLSTGFLAAKYPLSRTDARRVASSWVDKIKHNQVTLSGAARIMIGQKAKPASLVDADGRCATAKAEQIANRLHQMIDEASSIKSTTADDTMYNTGIENGAVTQAGRPGISGNPQVIRITGWNRTFEIIGRSGSPVAREAVYPIGKTDNDR